MDQDNLNVNPNNPPVPDTLPRDANFTPEQQSAVNFLLAKERRKQEAISSAKIAQEVGRVQEALEQALQSKSLSDSERENLSARLQEVTDSQKSAIERAEAEVKRVKDRADKDLSAATKEKQEWESRFKDSTISDALTRAAASHDAYQDTFSAIVKPLTRIAETTDQNGKGTGQFRVVVDLPDTDPATGNPVTRTVSVDEAAKIMREDPARQHIFHSGRVGGIGAGNSSTVATGTGGACDVRNLTQEQYMKIRRENPQLLGLRWPDGKRPGA